MPYVEGFGTWPFGEEWLWEAIATCYLPLLDVLDEHGGAAHALADARCCATSSRRPASPERFPALPARRARARRTALDVAGCREAGREDCAARAGARRRGLRARAAQLRGARRRPARRARAARRLDLLGHARGAAAARHRRRRAAPARARASPPTARASASAWRGGFWLPECAHAPWLDPLLEEAGVHATCVDLTDVLGRGAPASCAPLRTDDGPAARADRPRDDRARVERRRLPGARRLPRLPPPHRPPPPRRGRNDGAPYDHERRARAGARARRRLRRAHVARLDAGAAALGGPALAVCALDTELLGPLVVRGRRVARRGARGGRAPGPGARAARRRARARRASPPRARRPRRCRVDDLGHAARPVDLGRPAGRRARLAGARRRAARVVARRRRRRRAPRAVRELLALQSSDWAFMVTRDLAGPTRASAPTATAPRSTPRWHALGSGEPALRNLAPRARLRPAAARAPMSPPRPDPLLGVPAADRGRPRAPRAQALRAARRSRTSRSTCSRAATSAMPAEEEMRRRPRPPRARAAQAARPRRVRRPGSST